MPREPDGLTPAPRQAQVLPHLLRGRLQRSLRAACDLQHVQPQLEVHQPVQATFHNEYIPCAVACLGPSAAEERVSLVAALQRVRAIAPNQDVPLRPAVQVVVPSLAPDVVRPAVPFQAVVPGPAAQHVLPGPASECIGAFLPPEGVVPASSLRAVVSFPSHQGVLSRTA